MFVYLLMVVNYQTFGDPFVVILALPATLCGIVTMLFITGTTLNVPSLMGAIMAVGVASANSILLVTFAREQQLAGHTAFEAALSAGRTRIRPVLMTAAAMIVGMIPTRRQASGKGRHPKPFTQADDNPYYGHVGGASDSRHSSHSRFPHKNQLLDPSAATSRN